jgi:hypothetical protein
MLDAFRQHAKCQHLGLGDSVGLARAIDHDARELRHLSDPATVFLLLDLKL